MAPRYKTPVYKTTPRTDQTDAMSPLFFSLPLFWLNFYIEMRIFFRNRSYLGEKRQKRPKTGRLSSSRYSSKMSRNIFLQPDSNGTMYADQGKRPDQKKYYADQGKRPDLKKLNITSGSRPEGRETKKEHDGIQQGGKDHEEQNRK